jgi:hypothetical protein
MNVLLVMALFLQNSEAPYRLNVKSTHIIAPNENDVFKPLSLSKLNALLSLSTPVLDCLFFDYRQELWIETLQETTTGD